MNNIYEERTARRFKETNMHNAPIQMDYGCQVGTYIIFFCLTLDKCVYLNIFKIIALEQQNGRGSRSYEFVRHDINSILHTI